MTPTSPGATTGAVCRFCGERGDQKRHRAREMMIGLGEAFDYLECPVCGSLQIAEIPADLSRYYPADYYSYGRSPAPRAGRGLASGLRRRRDLRAVFGGG